MEWTSVKDRLPEIPEDKFGIRVIIATYDPVYAEISGNGYDVYEAHYGTTKNSKHFGENPLEFDFQTTYYGTNEVYWGPLGDQITHWMYLPDPPKE